MSEKIKVVREQRHLPLVLASTYRLRDALAAANGKSKFYFHLDFHDEGNWDSVSRAWSFFKEY